MEQADSERNKGFPFLKKHNRLMIRLVLAVLLLVAAVTYIQKAKAPLINKEITATANVIKEKLVDIGELVTQEYAYTEVSAFDSAKSANLFGHSVTLPLTRASYIYSYDGIIKAGVDFTRIDVVADSSSIIVTLPKAQILSHELIPGSFKLYDERSSIFNPFRIGDFDASNTEMKRNAETRALEKGLLEAANANAEVLLTNLMRSGYDSHNCKVVIQWR